MLIAPPTVASRLDAEIAALRLQVDSSQRSAAMQLDRLGVALRTQSHGLSHRLRGALPWLSRKPSVPRGVYLWGGVGRGKTLLMDYFFESLPSLAQRSHFYRFMRDVHTELTDIKDRTKPLDIVADRLAARAPVLCLDEFFVDDIADAMILAGLLDGLFRRGVVLVTTSNVEPKNLYKEGLQRQRFLPAIDLLSSHVDIIHLDGGADYRLRQLEQAPTYLDSALPDTASSMEKRFAALAGSRGSGNTLLTIEDRPLKLCNVSQGTVWLEFNDICEGPRSQVDYIEIARCFHTVFISNIPLFDGTNENAARRFIMLIDEFYDRGVKIVVSAAAPPTTLYRGERLAFEFERAASRLIEMQTQQYLAAEHRP